MTLSDTARVYGKAIIEPVARFFNRLGFTPNMISVMGFLGHFGAFWFIANGEMRWGGIMLLALAPLDAVDGTLARLTNKSNAWGAFLDSVLDRYAELVIFGGLLLFYMRGNQTWQTALIYIVITGSLLVSYTRARGHSLGIDIKSGIFSRFERYIVLIPCLLFNIPDIGLVILAVGTQLTAIQRIFAFYQAFSAVE